ncbi:MAG: CoA transferase [Acidimicrobiia bacterium]
MSSAGGLLAGIEVVEFGNLIAAPYAGMLLADLGADVVKVEPPGGDLGRGFGPYVGGESVFFMAVNRGKRSLALNPKDPEVRPWLDRLVSRADVVINNLRHGAMARMGYDEQTIRNVNPGVVYVVVSAFGADGPYADRAGIDVIFQAESGMISLTGRPDDPPEKTATTIGDYVAATNAALTICAALVDRERGGSGRRVDISLRDGLLPVQSGWYALHFASGSQPERTGTASPYLAPNQVFETADGLLALAIVSDRHFRILADRLRRPDLAERYRTNQERMANRPGLAAALEETFGEHTTAHWLNLLGDAGLPVGRVMDLAQVLDDPQILHNEMVLEVEHPAAGRTTALGSPLRVDGRPARAERPSPCLGQHSRQILADLGAPDETIEELVRTGGIVVS